jgi:hypothetical protein
MNALLFASLTLLVPAPAKEAEPTGTPPTLQYVRFDDKGLFQQKVTVQQVVPVQKAVTVVVNGVQRTKVVTEYVTRMIEKQQTMDARNFDIYELDGKKAEEPLWRKTLGEGAIVILAGDGQVPHPAFLKAVKPGTLVLVPKMTPPMPVEQPKLVPANP